MELPLRRIHRHAGTDRRVSVMEEFKENKVRQFQARREVCQTCAYRIKDEGTLICAKAGVSLMALTGGPSTGCLIRAWPDSPPGNGPIIHPMPDHRVVHLIVSRALICGACDQDERKDWALVRPNPIGVTGAVKCKGCGCASLSLGNALSSCKLGKWKPAPTDLVHKDREDIKPRPKSQPPLPPPPKPKGALALLRDRELNPISLEGLYRGRSLFIIAGGPSFAKLDHSRLRRPGVVTMALNNAAKTFRPNLWTHVDAPDHFIRSVFMDPTITKFTPKELRGHRVFNSDTWTWMKETVRDCPNVFFYPRSSELNYDTFLTEDVVCWGAKKDGRHSVMLPALRLAYYLGFRKVFLLGVDLEMSETTTYHFEQERKSDSVRGNRATYAKMEKWFPELNKRFDKAGFKVFNCNPESKLKAFPFLSFGEALMESLDEFGNVEVTSERTLGLYDTVKPPKA